MTPNKPSASTSFTRSQVASLLATLIDFGALVFLVEVGKLWYVAATTIGALLGAIANFTLGRQWSFKAEHGRITHQAVRYLVISAGSLILNSIGVYLFTDLVGLKYTVSKLVVAILVGVLFNFPLHRSYVFR